MGEEKEVYKRKTKQPCDRVDCVLAPTFLSRWLMPDKQTLSGPNKAGQISSCGPNKKGWTERAKKRYSFQKT